MPLEQDDEGSPGPKVQKVREPRHSSAKPATVPCCAVAYGVQLHGGQSYQAVTVLSSVRVQYCTVVPCAQLGHAHVNARR